MKKFNHLCLCIAISSVLSVPAAHALGQNTTNTGSGTQVSNTMQDFLLNLGLYYAKTNPKVAPVLTALGINTPADLKKFISGDASGSNFQDIITSAAMQYVFSNPKYSAALAQLGVTDFASLKALLSSGNGAQANLIADLAFTYIASNPNYQVWMSQLGINDASDLLALIKGNGGGTDIKAVILNFAMIYAQSNPKYGMYIVLLSALLGGNAAANGTVNIEDPMLGAFEGLSNAEIKRIQSTKKLRLK